MTRNSPLTTSICLCVFSTLLVACVSNARIEGVPPEEARIEVEAPEGEILRFEQPPKLVSAAIDEASLLIGYEVNGEARFGHTSRDDRQNLSTHIHWFPVYYLLPVDADAFAARSATADSVAVHESDVWQAFVQAVLEQLTPRQAGEGALLNYRDSEIVWFRSDDGSIAGADLKEKPADVSIANRYRIEAMTGSLFDILERFLPEYGIDDRRFILATGEAGPYARPFVIVDTDMREFGFLSFEPFTFGNSPNSYVIKGGKVGDHIVRSYVFEPLNRPLTFVSRLFYLATDSIADLSRRVYVNNFDYPDLEGLEIPALNTGPGMNLGAWEARLDKLVGDERFSGSIEVLVDGDAYFPRLIESVLEATESVKMRTYIFDSDDYATSLADMLKRRSAEVDVQVIVDGLGTLMAQEASAGTVPEDFEAPAAITNYLQSSSEVRVRGLTNPWAAGDHTKTTIIDSDHAYIGGMNIGREYRWEWHDMMMRVEGSIVAYIEREFDKAWAHGAVFGDFVLAANAMSNPMPESDEIEHPIRPLLTLPAPLGDI